MTIADIDNIALAESFVGNKRFIFTEEINKILKKYPLLKQYYEHMNGFFRSYLWARSKCSY
jgi:hypothetical protein